MSQVTKTFLRLLIFQELSCRYVLSTVQYIAMTCSASIFSQNKCTGFSTVVLSGANQRSVNFEMSFWCLQISQKIYNYFSMISALASHIKEV